MEEERYSPHGFLLHKCITSTASNPSFITYFDVFLYLYHEFFCFFEKNRKKTAPSQIYVIKTLFLMCCDNDPKIAHLEPVPSDNSSISCFSSYTDQFFFLSRFSQFLGTFEPGLHARLLGSGVVDPNN